MSKQTIDKKINALLAGETQQNALDFSAFLHTNRIPSKLYVLTIVGDGGDFPHIRPWVVFFNFCDFGSDTADAELVEFAHTHAHCCDYFITEGGRCGCGNQPGFPQTIFGKDFKNICRCPMQFINPDAETLENMKKLLLILKENTVKK